MKYLQLIEKARVEVFFGVLGGFGWWFVGVVKCLSSTFAKFYLW
jgi:hypothetical protein